MRIEKKLIDAPSHQARGLLEGLMDAVLFAIAQNPEARPSLQELKEALDDATGYELEDDELEQLAHWILKLVTPASC